MAKLYYNDRGFNQLISHMEGVHNEGGDIARRVKGNAERRLAPHRKSGVTRVTISQGEVDWFVNLEGETELAVESIEFGHWVKGKYETDKPKYVQGLYILTRAAGLL